MEEFLWILLEVVIKAVFIITLVMLSAAALVYCERKISAFIQDRIGPNRAGPKGLLQPFADVLKLFMKEDIVPDAAAKGFHRLAPVISLGITFAIFAILPFGNYFIIGEGESARKIIMGIAPNVNIGVLFILAMTSVGVYGITLAGWSSNNKYSLIGGLRSSAQMISYELSMGLAVMGVIMVNGTLNLNEIILHQSGWMWNVFLQPLGFVIFLVAAFAETNRAPFDLPEAEPELVGGFNTEYSGMKFGMFFLAEYGNMAFSSALMAILYFGGWQIPYSEHWIGLEEGSFWLAMIQFATLVAKVLLISVFFIWVRWSIPRFRYDQLMNLGWKVLLPLALFNIIATGIVMFLI